MQGRRRKAFPNKGLGKAPIYSDDMFDIVMCGSIHLNCIAIKIKGNFFRWKFKIAQDFLNCRIIDNMMMGRLACLFKRLSASRRVAHCEGSHFWFQAGTSFALAPRRNCYMFLLCKPFVGILAKFDEGVSKIIEIIILPQLSNFILII